MAIAYSDPPPAMPGVEHTYVTTAGGVRIHVAQAGPVDGTPVMLVHGFPQHWWEWRHQIGPLAADGYRVLVPDLRGAGWSDAPRAGYSKAELADDLLAVLDARDVERTWIAAHDWGGPAAMILLLRHPGRVRGFVGFNTIAPWLALDGPNLRHAWALWYQWVLACPGVGPRAIACGDQRFLRWLVRWVGGGYTWSDGDTQLYLGRLKDPARAYAGSQWYRTFQAREFVSWLRGEFGDAPVDVPLHWITGLEDPVITPVMHGGYARRAGEITFERVPGIGHWIVEQAPELVLARLRSLFSD